MKRTKMLLSMLMAFVLTFSSFGMALADTVKGNVIVETVFADPMGLMPGFSTDAMTSDIGALLCDSLLDVDANYNLIPKMAESWQMSKDNLSCTVKLRQGWKWHDGQEVTADDVKFSFELIMNPEANSPRRLDVSEYVKSVEVKDKYTLVFNANYAYAFFEYAILTLPYIYPKHLLEKVAPKDVASSAYMQKPISCGPMKFVEYRPGERIVLEKFDGYYSKFKPKTPCDKYIFQITPNQSTAILKARTGEANFCDVPAAEVSVTKQVPSLVVRTSPSLMFRYLVWNFNKPYFKDKKVRQALTYAINKEAIAKNIFKGFEKPLDSLYPPFYWTYNPNVKKYPYNVTLAKKLLDEAGWKVGKDGIREKDGVKLKFSILTLKGNPGREKTAVFLQNCWKQVGAQVDVRALEWNTLNKKYIDTKNFDVALLTLSHGSTPDPKGLFEPGQQFNQGSYNNPEVTRLCNEFNKTFDKAKQKEIIFKIQEIIAEELPYSVLIYIENIYTHNKNVKDVDVKWFGRWQPADWHVQ